MLKSLALVAVLAAAGCKGSDSSSQSAASGSSEQAGAAASDKPGRSGKIEFGSPRRRAGNDQIGAGSGRETVEERRKLRMEQMDTDHDGQISDAERRAARTKRAEDLHGTLDVDKDGKVTVTEVTNSRFRRLDPGAMDLDKNGDISVDELTKALEQRSTAWGANRFRDRDRLRGLAPPATGSGSAAGSGH